VVRKAKPTKQRTGIRWVPVLVFLVVLTISGVWGLGKLVNQRLTASQGIAIPTLEIEPTVLGISDDTKKPSHSHNSGESNAGELSLQAAPATSSEAPNNDDVPTPDGQDDDDGKGKGNGAGPKNPPGPNPGLCLAAVICF
jgi:hypothetical protein